MTIPVKVILLAGLVLSACRKAIQRPVGRTEVDTAAHQHAMPTPRPDSSSPEFQLDSGAAALLVSWARELRIGVSRDSVVALLGKPTSDHVVLSKENRRFITRALKYDLRRWRFGSVNEREDRYVALYFDVQDRLSDKHFQLAPSRIPSLPEVNVDSLMRR